MQWWRAEVAEQTKNPSQLMPTKRCWDTSVRRAQCEAGRAPAETLRTDSAEGALWSHVRKFRAREPGADSRGHGSYPRKAIKMRP
jgi:hypothetical protein